jgi:fibronectin type III domain protein/low-density lipoprotein receptor class B
MHYIRRFLAAAVGITALGVLVLTGAPAVAASAPAEAATTQATAGPPRIYWTNGVPGTIGRANIDGTGAVQNFVEGGSQPHGVAVDATHIYWTNVLNTNTSAGTIGRANLDGTGVDQNFITGVNPTGGLAVDGGHLYWGNQDNSGTVAFGIPATIARANLDGTGVDQNFITGADTASGIALDAAHIYWANKGQFTIGRASLDGTGVSQSFVNIGSGFPSAVAVDSGHIYWAGATGSLGRASLDGTGVNPSFVDAGAFPSGLAVDPGHLYWTHVNFSSDPNAFDDAIGRANLDGTGVEQNFIFNFSPEGVAVSPQAAVPPSPTVPAAPAIGSATFGNASATVRWTAPSTDGGSAVTGYLVRVVDSAGVQVGALRPAAATATSLVVTGLTNGSGYRFQVAAKNAVGAGPNSALSAVVVPATVPGAPVIATAAPGTAGGAVTATANWNPPASNGGSAVTGYRVRALRISATGTVLATTKSAVQPGSARQLTMTLQTGNYRFTVQAINKAGPGPQSARSNLVVAQ